MLSEPEEPSQTEALLATCSALAIELIMIARHGSFWNAAAYWLDNRSYTSITLVLLGRKTSSSLVEHHFWGLPYLTAAVSMITSAGIPFCLSAISTAAALFTCLLIHRMYGGWVATVFAAISIDWLRLSLLGGSEPLFMCLFLASLLAVRSNRWAPAALTAAVATAVRPVGIFVLVSMAGVLIAQRKWKMLGVLAALAVSIACLYLIPVWLLMRDPFISIERYRADWGASGFPLTLPFVTLIRSYNEAIQAGTWGSWARCIWPPILLASLTFIVSSMGRRRLLMKYPAEASFAACYLTFLVCYAYIGIAWHLPRFIVPLLPLILFSMKDVLPKNRWVVYSGVAVSAVIAGRLPVNEL